MTDIQLVIRIPEDDYEFVKKQVAYGITNRTLQMCIANGIPLPKGHGELFDKAELLRFLKCPKYETCDWKNCFDCNESRCINLNNINDLVPIIEADKEEEDSDRITCGNSLIAKASK